MKFESIDNLLEKALARGGYEEEMLTKIGDEIIKDMKFYIDKGGGLGHEQRHPISANQSKELQLTGRMRNTITREYIARKKMLLIGWQDKKTGEVAVIHELGMSLGRTPTIDPPTGHWRAGENGVYGLQIRISKAKWQRMRNFFLAKGYPLKKGTEAIYIPARPFMIPAVLDVLNDAEFLEQTISDAIMNCILEKINSFDFFK